MEPVTSVGRPTANVCYVLQEDLDLGDAVGPDHRAQAMEALIAREVTIPTGEWKRKLPLDGGIGLLVLEGVALHRVGIEDRFGAELLGEGDVLRSVQDDATPFPLPLTNDWLVLETVRVAVLDERFVRQLAVFPQVAGRLFARAIMRSRQLAVNMAIVHQARVDVRLHMLFWHLAGRWGRVRTDGVLVPLHLTHAVLADLVAARRPTVTSALSELARRGAVRPVPDGWLLAGGPPGQPPGASPWGSETADPQGLGALNVIGS